MNANRRRIAPLLCLCLWVWNGAQADDLGRLFTTSADRARIDALREGTAPVTEPSAIASTETADRLILNGTLTGSDGKRMVWVNGARVEADGRDHVLQRDGRVRLEWREGTRALKPGQGLDMSSGEIFERYARPAEPAPVSTPVQASAPVASPPASDAAPVTAPVTPESP